MRGTPITQLTRYSVVITSAHQRAATAVPPAHRTATGPVSAFRRYSWAKRTRRCSTALLPTTRRYRRARWAPWPVNQLLARHACAATRSGLPQWLSSGGKKCSRRWSMCFERTTLMHGPGHLQRRPWLLAIRDIEEDTHSATSWVGCVRTPPSYQWPDI